MPDSTKQNPQCYVLILIFLNENLLKDTKYKTILIQLDHCHKTLETPENMMASNNYSERPYLPMTSFATVT